MVEHSSGLPVASRSYREQGGEQGALRALLEEVEMQGLVVTMDAGHAGQVLVRSKGNCGQTWDTLTNLDWPSGAERRWQKPRWQRSHNGRWERRRIEVFTPHKKLLPCPHARQA